MAQLFIEDGFEWTVAPLDGDAYTLSSDAEPALRPRLVSLLKDMELRQARDPGPMASFDISFLWAELGLKRP